MTATPASGRERWLLPLSGMLLVMGGLLGVQYHTWTKYDPSQWQRGDAGKLLRGQQVRLDQQKEEIGQLRAQLTRYENEATSGSLSGVINEELQKSKMALGLVPLEGKGITLELGDSATQVKKDFGDSSFVVHDFDLLQLTNLLWASGAEAVSLNGQRIVSGSAIVCSGPLVQVNHETIPVPFVFTAVGDPDTLLSGLNMPNGLLDMLRGYGFRIKLARQDKAYVPAIAVAPRFRFAHPTRAKAPEPVPGGAVQ